MPFVDPPDNKFTLKEILSLGSLNSVTDEFYVDASVEPEQS